MGILIPDLQLLAGYCRAPGATKPMQLLSNNYSRNAAAVNSQLRKPLEEIAFQNESPNGAAEAQDTSLSPRWGLPATDARHQGLTPLAINFRPVGPAGKCMSFNAPVRATGAVPQPLALFPSLR